MREQWRYFLVLCLGIVASLLFESLIPVGAWRNLLLIFCALVAFLLWNDWKDIRLWWWRQKQPWIKLRLRVKHRLSVNDFIAQELDKERVYQISADPRESATLSIDEGDVIAIAGKPYWPKMEGPGRLFNCRISVMQKRTRQAE